VQTSVVGFVTLRAMGTFDVVENFTQDIAEIGWTVAAVTGDRTGCDWAYSVGLDLTYDHPELIIVGVDAPLAGAIVQAMAEKVAQGADLRDCGTVHVGPMQLRFRAVDGLFCSQGDWFNLGRLVMAEMGRSWPETLQIVWADTNGRYPEAPGEPDWFMRQPLLVG